MDILYLLIVFALIILFFISFTLFIRKQLINSSQKNQHSTQNIEAKLDKIIQQNEELLTLYKNKNNAER